jgi:hypothetical protein
LPPFVRVNFVTLPGAGRPSASRFFCRPITSRKINSMMPNNGGMRNGTQRGICRISHSAGWFVCGSPGAKRMSMGAPTSRPSQMRRGVSAWPVYVRSA